MAIEVHTHILAQILFDPLKWNIPAEFQGRSCTPITMIGMGALLGANKRKRSRSPASRRVKNSSGRSNNLSVVCKLFNKGSCTWEFCLGVSRYTKPDGAGELRYTRFKKVLKLVIRAGRHCAILKRDVKDAFQTCRWLLGFTWWKRFYKEMCLLFGLATAHSSSTCLQKLCTSL